MQQQTDLNFEYGNDDELDDLQFSTTVDTSIEQAVHVDPSTAAYSKPIPTSSAGLSGMIDPSTSMQIKGSNESTFTPQILKESSHPFACIFHCLFKFCALSVYVFGGWFTGSGHSGSHFIIITVCCILLLAADFWVVKNITGRLLVGLRWWNMLSEDGMSTRWIFESAETATVNNFDRAVFWTVLYFTPAIWGSLFFIGVLKLELGWLITVAVGLALSVSNVYGYWKCSSEQKAKFQKMVSKGAEMGVMSIVKNNFFGFLAPQQQQQPHPNTSATYAFA